MSQEYSRSLLRVCIAQICQNLGWNSIHSTPLELLTDVLERYLFQLGKVTHRYSEQFGRTEPRLEDVFLSFGHLGVHLNELEDYIKHVEPMPFAREVVAFPAGKRNNLQFPNPECAEIQNREEHVPDHLPLMYPSQEEEIEEPSTKIPGSPAEPSQEGVTVNRTEASPGVGDKRSLTSPGDAAIPAKRQRITTSSLPEEALHSQYEIKSVTMINNGILSPVKQGKLPDSNTPPQIALVKPKTVVTLDFSKDSNETPKIIEVKTIKAEPESGAEADRDKADSSEKKDKKAEVARVLKVIKEVQVKRGPGRPKSPGRSKVPKVIHSKGGADLSNVTSVAKGADILSKEKIIVLPGRVQDEPLDMSKKGAAETGKKTSAATPSFPPISMDELSKLKPDMTFEQRLVFLEYAQKFFMEKQKEVQKERDIDDTIQSVIKKSVREVDDRRSEFEKLQAELSGETSHIEKLYRAPHTQLMDSWRVSHISETYPSYEFDDKDKHGRDESDVSDGYPTFVSSPWRRGRPPKKPRGRPRGSGLLRGSPLGKESSPVKMASPYRRGRPPLYLRGVSPRGRPRGSGHRSPGRSPGRPRLSGGSPGRPRGSGGSPRGSGLSPGRPRLSGHSPGPGRPRGTSPRGRPRGRSPRSRSPRGGSPRAILNINFDEKPQSPDELHSPGESDTEHNESQTSFEAKASPATSPSFKKSPSYTKMEPHSPVQEDKSETPPRETPPPEHAPSPKVLTETISETPIPAEVVTIPNIKQEIIEEPKENKPALSRQDSKQDPMEAYVSLKKVEDENRDMYIEARRRSSEDRRIKEESKEREVEKEKVTEEKKDKHGEERKEKHKEHSHSRDRERSKEHRKKKKKKDKEKDRERKEKHKSKEEKDEPAIQPLQKLTIKIGGSSTTPGSFSIKQEPKVHSPAPVESPKPRPEIPKLVFKVLPPKPGSTPEHGKAGESDDYKDPTKQSWSSTPVQSEPEKPSTPKPPPKLDPKSGVKSEPIFTPIDETIKHKPSPTRNTTYMPLSPKFKPIPPAEPAKEESSKDESDKLGTDQGKADSSASKEASEDHSEETGTEAEDGHVAEEEVTVSVVGGRVVGGKSGGRGRKRRGSTRKTKPPKFARRPVLSAAYTPMEEGAYTSVKDEKLEEDDDKPPILQREPDKEASPSPPTLFPVNDVPSPITIPALRAAPPPPSPPLTKKSPPKQKHLKEPTPVSPLTKQKQLREPTLVSPLTKQKHLKEPPPVSPLAKEIITKPKPPPVSLPKAAKIKSPRRSSPRKSPKQISPPVKRKPKPLTTSPPKKISPAKVSPSEEKDFQSPRTPSMSTPSPSPDSPMYSPPLSPVRTSPLHFMIPPTPAFPTRTTSPPPSPPKPDLSPDEEDSSSTMPGGLPSMPPPSIPPMPPSSSAKKAMQRTVVAETVGTFVSASGEKIWICPACTMQDDGSPMIGCDICDDWYHWPCVDIVEEPDEDEQWYCPKCRPSKKQGKKPSKRGRKKKKP